MVRRKEPATRGTGSAWNRSAVLLAAIAMIPIQTANGLQAPTAATAPPDSNVVSWARQHAIPLPDADAPYADTAFAFLPPLVGSARIIAFGEAVHGGHQPLALRNNIIRYAVTHLGVTAVAIESGFTESGVVERFIQGDAGDIDSVVHAGITWQFDSLPENRELIQWLRDHNARAARKVHFYGLDVTGGNDVGMMPGAAAAIRAALAYTEEVAPVRAAQLRGELLPMLDRFLPDHYAEFTAAERDRLRTALDSLYAGLARDSSRAVRVSSANEYGRGLRNAWMAVRLNDLMAMGVGKPDGMIRAGVTLRDSTMAENAAWVLQQQGAGGRVFIYAHDGHVMNTQAVFDSTPDTLLGYRLRAKFGPKVVILATLAGTVVGATDPGGWIRGSEVVPAEPGSFSATLATVGVPGFVLDMRTADRSPAALNLLSRPWPIMMAGQQFEIVPRRAFDVVVYLDHITPTNLGRRAQR
jgi:erythromycin esterase